MTKMGIPGSALLMALAAGCGDPPALEDVSIVENVWVLGEVGASLLEPGTKPSRWSDPLQAMMRPFSTRGCGPVVVFYPQLRLSSSEEGPAFQVNDRGAVQEKPPTSRDLRGRFGEVSGAGLAAKPPDQRISLAREEIEGATVPETIAKATIGERLDLDRIVQRTAENTPILVVREGGASARVWEELGAVQSARRAKFVASADDLEKALQEVACSQLQALPADAGAPPTPSRAQPPRAVEVVVVLVSKSRQAVTEAHRPKGAASGPGPTASGSALPVPRPVAPVGYKGARPVSSPTSVKATDTTASPPSAKTVREPGPDFPSHPVPKPVDIH